MESTIKIGRVWGIPIGLSTSWFLIFALVTWSLAVGYLPGAYPNLSTPTYWIIGVITSLLFFGSVLLHELGHAYLAQRNRIPVHSITLFIFGGIAQIEGEPKTPGQEFRIAIAGPLVSLALAGIFRVLYLFDQPIAFLAAPSEWLARINLMLALFNMIPGFPLDGGRVFRAIVWYYTDFSRANRIATRVGKVVAVVFIGIGVFTMFTGNFFDGLWLVFIGWFLNNAASANYVQSSVHHVLQGVPVGEVMARNWVTVEALTPVSKLVEEYVLRDGPRHYFVTRSGYGYEDEPGKLYGLITTHDITRLPRAQWSMTPVERIMIPWEKLIVTQPQIALKEAMRQMEDAHINQLPVVQSGGLVGVLTREGILSFIRRRAELGV